MHKTFLIRSKVRYLYLITINISIWNYIIIIIILQGEIGTCGGTWLHVWSINGVPIASVNTALGARSALQQVLCLTFTTAYEWDHDNLILTGSSDGVIRVRLNASIVTSLALFIYLIEAYLSFNYNNVQFCVSLKLYHRLLAYSRNVVFVAPDVGPGVRAGPYRRRHRQQQQQQQ